MSVDMNYSVWQCPACHRTTQLGPLDEGTLVHCMKPAIGSLPLEQLCGHRMTRISIVQTVGKNYDGPDVLTR